MFSRTGRDLAESALNYETVDEISSANSDWRTIAAEADDYRVEKMQLRQEGQGQRPHHADLQSKRLRLPAFRLQAYEYVVNGKPALDWVVERQCVKADKDSGIINDANAWAMETMNNPRYPLELFVRVITVSLETMTIVRNLPELVLMEGAACDTGGPIDIGENVHV